jgi:glycosyltransferase involved in cell wall biosynthesis
MSPAGLTEAGPIYLNGRFLTQAMTGVQRFATELAAAMDQLALTGELPAAQILAPRGANRGVVGGEAPAYRRLVLRRVGRLHGQAWEQAELPFHARGGTLVSLGNTAPVLAGRRQVVVIHDAGVFDTPETYSPRFRAWYKTLWRTLVRSRALIATVSEFSRGRIAARLGIAPHRIRLMREGADHIHRIAADRGVLARHGLQPRRFALVVGSRVAHKNLAALGSAAKLLADRGMVLAMAGSIDPVVFQTGSAGPDGPVRALGRVDDAELRALYEAAACLLFPSRYEGFGLPPVEAIACGCPVLASGAGAVEEICGDAALYFDTTRPASIAETIGRLLDTPGLADDLRARGARRIAPLSWANAARDLSGIIRLAAEEGPRQS